MKNITVIPYSTDIEEALNAAITAFDIAEYEYYEEGKGDYTTLREFETVIEHLRKALDPLKGLEADGLI